MEKQGLLALPLFIGFVNLIIQVNRENALKNTHWNYEEMVCAVPTPHAFEFNFVEDTYAIVPCSCTMASDQ